MISKKCKCCGKMFQIYPSQIKLRTYCSKKCKWKMAFSSKEVRKKLSLAFKGKHHSKKTRKKMSKNRKGKCKGEECHNWKGGRIQNKRGYVEILKPNHPFCYADGYMFEHRFVMEQIIGRYLRPEEIVHHKGIKYPVSSFDNKGDNRPENLQLFTNSNKHKKHHRLLRKLCKI